MSSEPGTFWKVRTIVLKIEYAISYDEMLWEND